MWSQEAGARHIRFLVSTHVTENEADLVCRTSFTNVKKIIPAEQSHFDPIVCHQDTIAEGEQCADVYASPEEEGSNTTGRDLSSRNMSAFVTRVTEG